MSEESVNAEVQAPVAEEKPSGEQPQVAAEKKDVEINWARANETLRTQSQEIRQLRSELERMREPPKTNKAFGSKDRDDIPTYGELETLFTERERQYQAGMQEVQTRAKYNDFEDVINKYGKTLPESVKHGILNSPNPHLAAYEACKNSIEYYKDTLASQQHPDTKRIAENLQKPGSASAVGTTGALGQKSYFENLSDAEIIAMSNKYMGR